jgi:hypothetical protein
MYPGRLFEKLSRSSLDKNSEAGSTDTRTVYRFQVI